MKIRHHITRAGQVCDQWCREQRFYDRVLPAAFLIGVLIFLVYLVTLAAPLSFPSSSLVKIPQGASTKQVAEILKSHHIINSVLIFRAVERIFGTDHGLIAGEYFFPGPESVITVAQRIASGDHELKPVRVTIPEGATSKEIAELLDQKIPDFDTDTFYKEALPNEGRLFPDTYFFLPGEDADLVLSAMLNNFDLHVKDQTVAQAIAQFGKPLPEILTMASILEKEAANTDDRKMIAGILWHRIALKMPLQVDAVFPYIIGVNSLQLTKQQLQTDSPYNTYTNKGLPPGPIANPSIDAILAAVEPTKSNYLYYLSDLHGTMHYCATYSCQQDNAAKYLGH